MLVRSQQTRQAFAIRATLGNSSECRWTTSRYASRPLAFILRYVRRRPCHHAVIVAAVLAAVALFGRHAIRREKSGRHAVGRPHRRARRLAGVSLAGVLIAADNLLWRLAGWIASYTFVGVTGDLRRDLFRHLTGHSPSYFADRLPGTLTSRITATSNAVFTVENMFIWNVLPPCVATLAAIAFVVTVSVPMAAVLGGRRRHRGVRDVPAGGRRTAAASRFRQQGRRGRRRDGRRHRQHVAGAGILRPRPRAPAVRRSRSTAK